MKSQYYKELSSRKLSREVIKGRLRINKEPETKALAVGC